MWIVLLGCHGVGKSTLGQALARHLGWRYHEELGRTLAADPRWRAPDLTAAASQQAFDDELLAREQRRDLAWSPGAPRVIETWHPGNLAYAQARGSKIRPERLQHIRAMCQRQHVLVLPLLAPREVLAQRQSEAGDLSFFLSVAGQTLAQAELLGLRLLAPLWTHQDPPETLAARIAPRLLGLARSALAHPSPTPPPLDRSPTRDRSSALDRPSTSTRPTLAQGILR